MIEVKCTSCQTRYRIDERILPDETPTFKCSRCGHVFTVEPRQRPARRARGEGPQGASAAAEPPAEPDAPAGAKAPAAGGTGEPAAAAPPEPPQSAASVSAAQAPETEAAWSARIVQPAPDAAETAERRPERPRARPAVRRSPSAFDARQAGQGAAPSQEAAAPQPTMTPARSDAEAAPQSQTPAEPAEHASVEAAADAEFEAHAPSGEPAPQRSPAEQPAPRRSATEELRRRSFEQPPEERAAPGKNLSFDFSDEVNDLVGGPDSAKGYHEERWEVGEAPAAPSPPPRAARRIRATDIDEAREGQDFEQMSREEASAAAQRLEAELRGRSYTLHSAGFFIALFALVIFGFGVLSMLVCGAPIASAELLSTLPVFGASLEPPISPARRVALSQVQARYTKIKGEQTALIISGVAENVSSATLGTVQIEAALIGPAQQALRSQAVYCGNNLSSGMVGQMTPHELEFFEKLNGPANFSLSPQGSTPFVIAFVGPPAGAVRFQLRVAKAEPAADATPPSPGG